MSSVLESSPESAQHGERPGTGNADRGAGVESGPAPAIQPMQLEIAEGTADPSGVRSASQAEPARVYITGWRLYVVSFSCVGCASRHVPPLDSAANLPLYVGYACRYYYLPLRQQSSAHPSSPLPMLWGASTSATGS